MDAGREPGAVGPIIIGLDSICSYPRRAIEVNGDEARAPIIIRDRATRWRGDEDIAVPGHDDAVSLGLKNRPQSLGDTQRFVFLADPLAGNPAAIEAAVAG